MKNLQMSSMSPVNGGQEKTVFGRKEPLRVWDESEKRSIETKGVVITALLPGNFLEPARIEIADSDPLPDVTDEMIFTANMQGKFLYVQFEGLKITIESDYRQKNTIKVSGTAKGARVI